MRLAEQLGRHSVDELLQEMGSDDLMEWAAWEKVNGPLGAARQDLMLAQIACVVANAWRSPKKAAVKFEDCMLFPSPFIEKQRSAGVIKDPSMQFAIFKAWASAVDAADLEIKMGESVKGDRI